MDQVSIVSQNSHIMSFTREFQHEQEPQLMFQTYYRQGIGKVMCVGTFECTITHFR